MATVAPKLFLLFSHRLTQAQRQEAQLRWQVEEFRYLPAALQAQWSQVPLELAHRHQYLQPIWKWLEAEAQAEDLVLVQGESGLVHLTVQYCRLLGLRPIYASTHREVQEQVGPDGSVRQQRKILHRGFLFYE